MFFRTTKECDQLAESLGFNANPGPRELRKTGLAVQAVRIDFAGHKVATYALARRMVSWFGPTRRCLLWLTEFGIWPSSENLHLYYRVRQSYHDYRELFEAPGHVFLSHEEADIVTFLDLVIQFGWGGFLFGTPNDSYLTISHDEWILFESSRKLDQIIEYAEELTLPYRKIDSRHEFDA